MMLVIDHSKHWRNSVVCTLNRTVSARVLSVCREFLCAEELIHGRCKLGAKLRFVIGQKGERVSPEWKLAGHQCVDRTFRGDYGFGDSDP